MKKIWTILILIIALMMIYNFAKKLWRWPRASERLKEAKQALQAVKLKNWQLKQEKQYRESDEFAEKEIRNKLMMSKEGETVVILPENAVPSVASLSANSQEKTDLPPWRQWWELFK